MRFTLCIRRSQHRWLFSFIICDIMEPPAHWFSSLFKCANLQENVNKDKEEESLLVTYHHTEYNVLKLVLWIRPTPEEQWADIIRRLGTISRSKPMPLNWDLTYVFLTYVGRKPTHTHWDEHANSTQKDPFPWIPSSQLPDVWRCESILLTSCIECVTFEC